MNDKILTIAFMLFFLMIGINAFLYMASTNLYDSEGNKLNIYYGLDDDGFGSDLVDTADATEIDAGVGFSSTVPSQQQGLIVGKTNDDPTGLSAFNEFYKLGAGVQLVLLKFSVMFPIIAPITTGIATFAFALQFFVIAYGLSILIRGILGRIV